MKIMPTAFSFILYCMNGNSLAVMYCKYMIKFSVPYLMLSNNIVFLSSYYFHGYLRFVPMLMLKFHTLMIRLNSNCGA